MADEKKDKDRENVQRLVAESGLPLNPETHRTCQIVATFDFPLDPDFGRAADVAKAEALGILVTKAIGACRPMVPEDIDLRSVFMRVSRAPSDDSPGEKREVAFEDLRPDNQKRAGNEEDNGHEEST